MSIPPPPKKRGFHLPVNQVVCGSNIEVVSDWPADCIDSIVTDPPYGLGFMGKEWDTYSDKSLKHYYVDHSFAGNKRPKEKSAFTTRATAAGSYDFSQQGQINFYNWMLIWAKAMLRITKPGGFLLCFGGTRTFHRLTCAIEDAGWEIRDCMMWLYGSGFPKSHDISKAIDKKAGAERKVIRKGATYEAHPDGNTYAHGLNAGFKPRQLTAATTPLAQLWNGYGTALKPAWEPIIVAMKPKEGSFADNAEKYGVAGLNIDGGRIGTEQIKTCGGNKFKGQGIYNKYATCPESFHQGRWPANLILDEEAGKMLDGQSGKISYGKKKGGYKYQDKEYQVEGFVKDCKPQAPSNYADSGGASRFFYCAKTSKRERNLGLENKSGEKVNDGRQTPIDNPYQRGETIRQNTHPTVKPLALMKYLCTLLKMPGQDQVILDPFLGSGTTAMACKELGINYIGIEKEQEYCQIAEKRINATKQQRSK